jgi:hypothetical protein
MEGMLKVYMTLFRPPKAMTRKNAVKLLKDRKEYVAYSGNPGAAGHYNSGLREMVLYDTGKWSDEEEATPTGDTPELDLEAIKRKYDMDILGIAAHEGWHQYFHFYVVSDVYLPSWINEGMGDYFYTATPKKIRGQKVPAELGRLNTLRLGVIQHAVREGKHIPVADLIRYSQQDYYSNGSLCYAQGWSLCHFFLHSKDYKDLPPEFIRSFRETKSWEKNTDAAFKKIDLAKLETEWKAWVLAQVNTDPAEEALKKWLEQRRGGGDKTAEAPDKEPEKQGKPPEKPETGK